MGWHPTTAPSFLPLPNCIEKHHCLAAISFNVPNQFSSRKIIKVLEIRVWEEFHIGKKSFNSLRFLFFRRLHETWETNIPQKYRAIQSCLGDTLSQHCYVGRTNNDQDSRKDNIRKL